MFSKVKTLLNRAMDCIRILGIGEPEAHAGERGRGGGERGEILLKIDLCHLHLKRFLVLASLAS